MRKKETYNAASIRPHITSAETSPHHQEGHGLTTGVNVPLADERNQERANGIQNDEGEGHEDAVDADQIHGPVARAGAAVPTTKATAAADVVAVVAGTRSGVTTVVASVAVVVSGPARGTS